MYHFADRYTAGELLAEKLINYKQRQDTLILALPRGGVPVAQALAENLELPLDIFLVRKLGLPTYPEVAMGALASGGLLYLDQKMITEMAISQVEIDKVIAQETTELQRREDLYHQDLAPHSLSRQRLIVVDDGMATGATLTAAIQALRQQAPKEIIVALPVAPPESCQKLKNVVDDLICLLTPHDFETVGQYYEDFPQLEDQAILEILQQQANQQRPTTSEPFLE